MGDLSEPTNGSPEQGCASEISPEPGAPLLSHHPDLLTQKEHIFQAAEYIMGTRYGWQSNLARRMGVDPRTVRRWLSGEEKPSPTAWNLLKMMIKFRAHTGLEP